MDVNTRRAWAWTLRKWSVSAFLIVHIGATLIWVMPNCPIRERCHGLVSGYIMPIGMCQYWGMFAPDPMKETLTLEAEVFDAKGLRYSFAFPKLADFSILAGVPRFRHSKYAANLAIPDLNISRELAARHVARQLGLPREAYPVTVRLIYQVRTPPPPGGPPADPMTPTVPYLIGNFPVASLDGVTK